MGFGISIFPTAGFAKPFGSRSIGFDFWHDTFLLNKLFFRVGVAAVLGSILIFMLASRKQTPAA
jgi:hypothetical protein